MVVRTRLVVAMASSLLLGVAGSVVAAPKAAPAPKTKVKPTPATSTASASADAPAPPSSAGAVVSPVSPLTPRPEEAPPVKAAASGKPAQAYDELMAEIAALRARVGVVSNKVWTSRLSVKVRLSGSHARIASAKLLLDGAQVWAAPKAFSAEDDVQIFEGGVAPGVHLVAIEIERRDDRDETFRTVDRTTATLTVPQGKRVEVEARLEDDSSMGGDFPGDSTGKYDLRLKMKVKAAK